MEVDSAKLGYIIDVELKDNEHYFPREKLAQCHGKLDPVKIY